MEIVKATVILTVNFYTAVVVNIDGATTTGQSSWVRCTCARSALE